MPSPPSYPRVPTSYPAPSIVLSNESTSKNLSIVPTLPTDATPEDEYGAVLTFDFSAPETQVSLNIKWVKASVYETYRTLVKTRGAILNITTDSGEVFVGQILGTSRKTYPGTELFEVDISLRRTN